MFFCKDFCPPFNVLVSTLLAKDSWLALKIGSHRFERGFFDCDEKCRSGGPPCREQEMLKAIISDVNVLVEEEVASEIFSRCTSERDVARLLCQENYHVHFLPLIGHLEDCDNPLYDLIVRILEMEHPDEFKKSDKGAATDYCRYLLSRIQLHKKVVFCIMKILSPEDCDLNVAASATATSRGKLSRECVLAATKKRTRPGGKQGVTLQLSATCTSVGADIGETAFFGFCQKVSVKNPIHLPLYEAFERLSDCTTMPAMLELKMYCRAQDEMETLGVRNVAQFVRLDDQDDGYHWECVVGECERPLPSKDVTSEFFGCRVQGARSAYGNGVCNVAHLCSEAVYWMFRNVFLEYLDIPDYTERVAYLDGRIRHYLPCSHVRNIVMNIVRLREGELEYMRDWTNVIEYSIPWCGIKICMDLDPVDELKSAVNAYVTSARSWISNTMSNPLRLLASKCRGSVLFKRSLATAVNKQLSESFKLTGIAAEYITVSSYDDINRIVDNGVKACHFHRDNDNYLELAFAIAERIAENPDWEKILATFLAGRSEAAHPSDASSSSSSSSSSTDAYISNAVADNQDSMLTKLIGYIGSTVGKCAECPLRSRPPRLSKCLEFSDEEILDMVDVSFPFLSKELSRRALNNWNSGTVALILTKLDPAEIQAYLRSCTTQVVERLDKRIMAVAAAYVNTSSSRKALRIVKFRDGAPKMFAKHHKSWDGRVSSPEYWQDMVQPKYEALIDDMKRTWPPLRHIDGSISERKRELGELKLLEERGQQQQLREQTRLLRLHRLDTLREQVRIEREQQRLDREQLRLDRARERLNLESDRLGRERERLSERRERISRQLLESRPPSTSD